MNEDKQLQVFLKKLILQEKLAKDESVTMFFYY